MSELDRLVRRLRGFSPSAWSSGNHREAILRLAAELVEVGGEGHLLPVVPDFALADVVAVVGADAYRVDPDRAAALVRAALEHTR